MAYRKNTDIKATKTLAQDGKKKAPSKEQADQDDLLWGIHSVTEALEQGQALADILVQRGKTNPRLQHIIDMAREKGIKLSFVDGQRMRVPRSCNHQGIVARLAAVPLCSLDELLSKTETQRLLVLDSIQDPRNLGSILRSALAAGFRQVVITRERSAPVSGTVARTSAGAVAHLQIAQVTNLVDGLQKIKDAGYWVHGAVVDDGATSIYEADFRGGSVCLVIGSEGKGIRPLVKKNCDHLITIPMHGDFDSLNASVAAALIMFEVTRQNM